ncbi:hypothetical protein Lal_00002788 [Lupinus albus]|uniref:Uncharacterized protein n=1 Tax=Lupinus albus TaxID=3870 RepID=A0A6A4NAW0_LUPAL|nr:hypothetical protein Lalb_Chr22g0350191 [Lupinus albus]KAF1882608.1 hypothetical protein Lal_00002788 [Lupinus albus]
MQCMLNIRATYGVPLSLSGITHPPLALSHEMEDHAMRMQTSLATEGVQPNQEISDFFEVKGETNIEDLSNNQLGFTAKAA